MSRANRQQKMTFSSVSKGVKLEINRVIEKGLAKAVKKVDSLEKALKKLKESRQKAIQHADLRKAKNSKPKKKKTE